MNESIRRLEQKIDEFLDSRDPVISASRVIDPLLEIWGLATEVDPSVAVPVERLLTALEAGADVFTTETPVELVRAVAAP